MIIAGSREGTALWFCICLPCRSGRKKGRIRTFASKSDFLRSYRRCEFAPSFLRALKRYTFVEYLNRRPCAHVPCYVPCSTLVVVAEHAVVPISLLPYLSPLTNFDLSLSASTGALLHRRMPNGTAIGDRTGTPVRPATRAGKPRRGLLNGYI